MQDIHLAVSTVLGSDSGMASVGQFLAQTPQRLQPRLPFGWGTLPPFLYGRLPGTCGNVQSSRSALRMITYFDRLVEIS